MFGKKWRKTAHRKDELSGYIDEGSEIEGTYTFTGTVMLNGKFKGEIQSTDTLIIGERGIVHANVHTGTVLVSGEVVGNVTATERVELRGSARVFGDIDSPVVVVEEGVLFEGHCRMTRTHEDVDDAPSRDLSVVGGVRGASPQAPRLASRSS